MKLTILYVCCARTWRGGEQQLINLFWALDKEKHKQIIFCVKGSAVEQYCIEHKIEHRVFIKRGGFDPLAALRLKKICHEIGKIDVLYLNDSDAHTMGYLASMFGLNLPSVLTRKKVLPIRTWLSVKKYNASFISYIICVSATVKQILSERIRDTSKLIVVHEGIEPLDESVLQEFILPAEIQARKFDYLLGYTAAISAEKDHYTFLKTAAVLVNERKRHIGFIIAGDGPLKEDIAKRIKEMGLSNHVFMLGFINNVPALIKKFDLMLFTSQSEAFSISILESFYLKIPVISTQWPGVNEMIEHGKTGLLSPMMDTTSLADNVEALLADKALQNTIAANAHDFVKEYNYDNMAKKIEKVFFMMLKPKTPTA